VNDRLASEIAEINLEKKAALTTSQGLSANVEAITAETQEARKQLTLMQEQYNKGQFEVVALQTVIAELNAEKEQYISNLSALEGEAKNAKLELSEKNDESQNTTALLDEAVKQIEDLQTELQVSVSKQQLLQDEINDLRAEKQNVDQSDNDEIESLRNDLISLNKAIVSEQDEVIALKKRIKELNVALDGYKKTGTPPSQPTVDLEAHLEGKLLINKSADGVGFKYNNAQRLYLEYELSFITEKDGPVALRGRPSLGNDKDIFIPIQGDVANYLNQGQVIEFELVIFNALDNTKSKAWRGKFKIDLETSKLVIIH
jgi:predicted nuclease with TOPRIM domain